VPPFTSQLYDTIIKFLGPHGPDGLLAFVLFAGALAAIATGLDPYLACGFAVIIYVLYSRRRTSAEHHAERMADADVAKTELALRKYREGQLARIERDKIRALSPPARRK
jgi:hypothetical protein